MEFINNGQKQLRCTNIPGTMDMVGIKDAVGAVGALGAVGAMGTVGKVGIGGSTGKIVEIRDKNT